MALDSTQLRTFAVVVHEGSFEAAAHALRVTPSAVSQRIKALEQTVGQPLVRRSKPCHPTDAGRPLLRLAGQIAILEQDALQAAGSLSAGEGRLPTRVALVVNADSLATWFLDAMAAMPPRFALSYDLRRDDQDYTAQLLRDGTVMAAVTAEAEAVRGCRVERLGAMRYRPLAAPDFAATYFPDGLTPDAVATAPMIALDRKDRLQLRFMRTLSRRRLDPPVHYVPSVSGFNHAIRLGLGWGMVPEQIAAGYLAAGGCVDIGGGRHLDVPLYWQHWRLESEVLRALTDAVRAAAAAELR